jgi:hypothetical protein
VKIQARTASKEDKEYLANALFYLRESSTGSIEGDILKLSALISGYVVPCPDPKDTDMELFSLVEQLGLTSSLSEYKVPKEDFQRLAEDSDDLVEVLNSIY